ncbi:unnamed protein product [Cuscuta europaea]|uniref:Uncharacterized protein n=1 Tax=Cuscuta europaea TaxID=41803 RepID=A0A9P1E513_CUSEU|nr:unnamed protein product [Cuscuta europaea]
MVGGSNYDWSKSISGGHYGRSKSLGGGHYGRSKSLGGGGARLLAVPVVTVAVEELFPIFDFFSLLKFIYGLLVIHGGKWIGVERINGLVLGCATVCCITDKSYFWTFET